MKVSTLIISFSILTITGCGNMPQAYETQYKHGQNPAGADLNENNIVSFRFIDIGQGDATLITTPNGKAVLIDGGVSEMGRERVLPLLAESDSGLELIIASHYDADHIGGIPEVIKGMDGLINTPDDIIPAGGILDRGKADAIDTANLSDYFIISSDFRFSLEPGDGFAIDGVSFSILAQNGVFEDGYYEETDPKHENAHSISLLIRYKNISYLTSGDLPGPNFASKFEPYDLETHIAELIDGIDILHVSHHGSHNSTPAGFVQSLMPKIAIISAGENDYGHPHPLVISNLLDAGTAIYLTEGNWIEDKEGLNIVNGDICMESNGENISIGECL